MAKLTERPSDSGSDGWLIDTAENGLFNEIKPVASKFPGPLSRLQVPVSHFVQHAVQERISLLNLPKKIRRRPDSVKVTEKLPFTQMFNMTFEPQLVCNLDEEE